MGYHPRFLVGDGQAQLETVLLIDRESNLSALVMQIALFQCPSAQSFGTWRSFVDSRFLLASELAA
jgi:hypothetical protein